MKNIHHLPVQERMRVHTPPVFALQGIREAYDETDHLREQLHSHDHFEVVWVIRGGGTYSIDLQSCPIADNLVFGFSPGQVHQVTPQEGTEGFVLSFAANFLDAGELGAGPDCRTNLMPVFSGTGGILINKDLQADMRETVGKMMHECNNLFLFKTEILKRYVKIFLIYLSRAYGESPAAMVQSRNREMALHFMQLVEKHFTEQKMVTDYAGKLCVTPNYLNEIIKKVTGHSAGHHIRQRVVLEAKRMGMYSGLSMKEIAYGLGFADAGHFSKFFKAVTGTNFSSFKKMNSMQWPFSMV